MLMIRLLSDKTKKRCKMQQYADSIPLFKALADETRLAILDMLSSGEFCA